jgi:hypothetical protein
MDVLESVAIYNGRGRGLHVRDRCGSPSSHVSVRCTL